MILLLGDSNLRKTFDEYGEQLKEDLGCEIVFEQTTTNESIGAALEKERDPKPTIFYISSILNEISNKVSRGKAIVDVIKNVTLDQNDIVNKHANKAENSTALFLLVNPMMRFEPKWYEERLSLVHYYINKHNIEFSPNNVSTVAEVEINLEDLDSDKVHLNDAGRKKMYEKMTSDLKIAKEEVEKFLAEGMEWDDLARLSQKTPKTAKKRKRNDQETESSGTKKRKEKDDESVLETLKSFMSEIREDRKLVSLQTNKIEEEVTKLKESEIEIRQEIQSIKNAQEDSNIFTATVREDLDAVENENLRNTILVKKMKRTTPISNDRNEQTKTIQTSARELVKEILGDESSIAYIALLYTGKDGSKITVGKMPAFKIVFKTKQQGIEFREKAVQRSKQVNDKLHKAYIASQQCVATRIRTIIMWSIADSLKNQAKGIDSWVNQGLNKPILQVKGEEKFQRSYSYVAAVLKYEDKIKDEAKEEALKLAKRFFQNQIEKIFIVIKD
jgi:hypothetical protein